MRRGSRSPHREAVGRHCPTLMCGFGVTHTPHPILLSRYRARVEKVESAAKVHIFYIDYGNVSARHAGGGGGYGLGAP